MERYFKILAIDNDQNTLNQYEKILSSISEQDITNPFTENRKDSGSGSTFELVMCRDGEEGIRKVEESIREDDPFSVALINSQIQDGQSEEKNTLSYVEKIRTLDPFINILMLTSNTVKDVITLNAKMPLESKLFYIRKPFNPYEIRQFTAALGKGWFAERQFKKLQEELGHKVKSSTQNAARENEKSQDEKNDRKRTDKALRLIVEATASYTCKGFFDNFVKHLSDIIGFRCVLIGEIKNNKTIKTLSCWFNGGSIDSFEYDISKTPCRQTLKNIDFHYKRNIANNFIGLHSNIEMKVHSYLGLPLVDSSGDKLGIIAILHDKPMDELLFAKPIIRIFAARTVAEIERKRAKELYEHLAYYDYLTDLMNKSSFNRRLSDELSRIKRSKEKIAILYMDLDRFKNINDSLGHAAGDRLLIEVARRIEKCIRKHDSAARLGGDEFASLLTQIKTPQCAAIVAERIIAAIKKPFYIDNCEILTSASIGISLYPENGHDIDTLINNADQALYYVKKHGKNNYKFCDKSLNRKVCSIMKLKDEIKNALEKNEFLLYFQPQININTEEIIGVEALIRWKHPERGILPPSEFISIAEETGLIQSISEWVLRKACIQSKEWHESGCNFAKVGVNISARHFTQNDLIELVTRVLNETGTNTKWIDLEITEKAILQEQASAVSTLTDLVKFGINVSLDDFGTGYSSLTQLTALPIKTLKVDCSFIQNITKNKSNRAMTDGIINLAHKLGLKVIAEGVETQEQLDCLRGLNCDGAQGYLICRPMSAKRATKLLKNHRTMKMAEQKDDV